MADVPSYEELAKRPPGFGRPKKPLRLAIEALEPGDVLDVTDLVTQRTPRTNASTNPQAGRKLALGAAANAFGRGACGIRTINGRLYVIRFKPEDIRKA
jgi:hypothetical protein